MNIKQLDEFSNLFQQCDSRQQIQLSFAQLVNLLDIEFYSFAAVFVMQEPILYLVDGYPAAWTKRYREQEYKLKDPLVKHCMQHTDPLLWSDIVFEKSKEALVEQQIMREAAQYGLKHGITFPVHGPGIESSMLSLSWQQEARSLDDALISALKILAFSIHGVAKVVAQNECVIKDLPPKLTSREQQCLVLTANGKTAKEISHALDLSESTVTFHLKNVMDKMGASNRPHAVARAISESRIILM